MTLTFENLGSRERFLIGEALAIAVATDRALPETRQRPSDSAGMIEILRTNFAPQEIAMHSYSASLNGDLPALDYYAGDCPDFEARDFFWDSLSDLMSARESVAVIGRKQSEAAV